MVPKQTYYAQQFDLEPRACQCSNEHRRAKCEQSKDYRQTGANAHDRKKARFHLRKSLKFGGSLRLRVVDKQAWQVKQPGEPGHHEDEVKRLEP